MYRVLTRIGLALLCLVVACGASSACQMPLWNALLTGATDGSCINIITPIDSEALEGVDAGACGAAASDNACAACLKRGCCAEGLACLAASDPCTADDPTALYMALAHCAADACADDCVVPR
jgi:hypothetical protein